jgi:glycosyltransferase involved in cell wall biosynthesis
MRVLIATTKTPFVTGGAEVHAEELRNALTRAGHQAAIIAIPFKWYPPERIVEQMLAIRLLHLADLNGLRVDRLIGLKFPAYLAQHPDKVLWILHQHRQAYDLWDHPLGDLQHYANGQQIRDAIRFADRRLLPQARRIFANSANVARRLKNFCDVDSEPLYHPPPGAAHFYTAEAQPYLYFPSRINRLKRQDLVIRALAHTREAVRVQFSGPADSPEFEQECRRLAASLRVSDRVLWLGVVDEERKRELYASSLGVLYPPLDEDYGYVTLEAMLSAKPLITCMDSGGPLEFVVHGETGFVAEAEPSSLAAAMDGLWQERARAKDLGAAARARYDEMKIDWEAVIERLLA